MRVLLDARPGDACLTGIGRYARTLRGLLPRVRDHACWSLSARGDLTLGGGCAADDAVALPALRSLREQIDVYHSPFFHVPPLLETRRVITLHDAIPVVRPDLCGARLREDFAAAADGCRRVDRIVCPSRAARDEVVKGLGVDPTKIRVVPETPDPSFRRLAPEDPERGRVGRVRASDGGGARAGARGRDGGRSSGARGAPCVTR